MAAGVASSRGSMAKGLLAGGTQKFRTMGPVSISLTLQHEDANVEIMYVLSRLCKLARLVSTVR